MLIGCLASLAHHGYFEISYFEIHSAIEDEIRIPARPCNILYIIGQAKSSRYLSDFINFTISLNVPFQLFNKKSFSFKHVLKATNESTFERFPPSTSLVLLDSRKLRECFGRLEAGDPIQKLKEALELYFKSS